MLALETADSLQKVRAGPEGRGHQVERICHVLLIGDTCAPFRMMLDEIQKGLRGDASDIKVSAAPLRLGGECVSTITAATRCLPLELTDGADYRADWSEFLGVVSNVYLL